jgi:hypothetical protein
VLSLVVFIYGETTHEQTQTLQGTTKTISKSHAYRTRSKIMLRAMTETQTVELLAHIWNTASGTHRLQIIRKLFDGFPPPRLTSIAELMKLTYPLPTLSVSTTSFLEEFDKSDLTDREKLTELEKHSWPKLSDSTPNQIMEFLQLSSSDVQRVEQFHTKTPEGWIWDKDAVLLGENYWNICDFGGECSFETPSCENYQGNRLCVKKCIGDVNCYSFVDPHNKRGYPGKCIAEQNVCQGFSYYDPQQEKDKMIPFGGEVSGNGWSIGDLPWESGVSPTSVSVIALAVPLLLFFCV